MSNQNDDASGGRMPLEERLARLSAGCTCSPQFSVAVVRNLGDTPILPLLDSMGEYRNREEAYAALKLLRFRCPPERMTFGKLAQKIRSEWYDLAGRRARSGQRIPHEIRLQRTASAVAAV